LSFQFFKGISHVSPIAVEKPPEADDWYKEALERARKAAQNVKQGGSIDLAYFYF
jgi:hypothetical protein